MDRFGRSTTTINFDQDRIGGLSFVAPAASVLLGLDCCIPIAVLYTIFTAFVIIISL